MSAPGVMRGRWKMERLHCAHKSGRAIERARERGACPNAPDCRGEEAECGARGRLAPDPPCSPLLREDEWNVLYCAAERA